MDDNIGIIDLLRQFSTRHDPDRLDDVLDSLAPHDESVVFALAIVVAHAVVTHAVSLHVRRGGGRGPA